MNAARPAQNRDPFVGYFAGVILALIASGWLAGLLVGPVAVFSGQAASETARANIAAGLFLGTVAANPFNAIAAGRGIWHIGLRAVLGFIGGMFVQIWVFTPFTGDGMSNYMLLLLAGLAIPAAIIKGWAHTWLTRRGLTQAARTSRLVSGFLNWSDRSMFVLLMGMSFAGFAVLATAVVQILLALGLVLSAMVIWIARAEVVCERAEDLVEADLQVWLALDPEKPAIDAKRDGFANLKDIGFRLLPGAFLIGGTMQLAVYVVSAALPVAAVGLADPAQVAQYVAVFAASALLAVLVGMFGALGIGLAALRAVAWSQKWSAAHLREKYLNMIRLMYFCPIKRYWDQNQASYTKGHYA